MGIKRFGAVWACLVLIVVVAVVLAAQASALPAPAWFECVKASPKDTGDYTSKTCSQESQPGAGKYALKEGVGKDKEIKGKAEGVVIHDKAWQPPAENECGPHDEECTLACKSGKYQGREALPNLEKNVIITYSKCQFGDLECSSPDAQPGEVKTKPLRGELGYVDESPTAIGLKLESEATPGGTIAEVNCDSNHELFLGATIAGEIVGAQEGDVNNLSKDFRLVDSTAPRLGELFYDDNDYGEIRYTPPVNLLGWAGEVAEIEASERPPQILKDVLCGEQIERQLGDGFRGEGPPCGPAAYMGLDQTVVSKGEALMVKS